ncbi:hypothetical protein T439DRAFT_318327 [Meredithblackwellia eburnea MCA 4105]
MTMTTNRSIQMNNIQLQEEEWGCGLLDFGSTTTTETVALADDPGLETSESWTTGSTGFFDSKENDILVNGDLEDAIWLDPSLLSTSLSPSSEFTLPTSVSTSGTPPPQPAPSTQPPKKTKRVLPTPDECWGILHTREQQYHSHFLYSVPSTRIYCRPTCPSRRPKSPKGVCYFLDYRDAEKEGYRACKRCMPTVGWDEEGSGEGKDPMMERRKDQVNKAVEVIRERGGKIKLKELGEAVGVSAFHLHRCFRSQMRVTPEEFGRQVREEIEHGARKVNGAKKPLGKSMSGVARDLVGDTLANL